MLEQLLKLAPPVIQEQASNRDEKQWEPIEKELGTALPQDYKDLVEAYGAGWFGNYITVYSPFVNDLNLLRRTETFRGIYNYNRKVNNPKDCPPFGLFPEANGLLTWGESSIGIFLCWLVRGEPEQWPIIVLAHDYSEVYREYPMTITEFIFGWLSGKIRPDFYPPELYPLVPPLFRLEIDESLPG